MARPEDALHESVARSLTVMIAPPGEISPHGVYWFSIEHRNARNRIEGAKRKARGVVAGVPDIIVGYQRETTWIELKATRGTVSGPQKALHAVLQWAGQTVFVCRSLDDVVACLAHARIPTRGRIAA